MAFFGKNKKRFTIILKIVFISICH